jgi:hypothetical protein
MRFRVGATGSAPLEKRLSRTPRSDVRAVPDRVAPDTAEGPRPGQHQVKEPTVTGRYQTELLRQPEYRLNCEDTGQSVAPAFLDAEEVRGSRSSSAHQPSTSSGYRGLGISVGT